VLHVVDTVEVDPDRAGDYIELIGTLGVTVMTEAGASLVSCASTSAEIGEPVSVQVVWGCAGYPAWNEIRMHLVLDPRWHELAGRAAALRLSGTRRFYTPLHLPGAPVASG
jgi:hypothetical protein